MGRLIVKKFGGTSVADSVRIEAVADNVEAEISLLACCFLFTPLAGDLSQNR